MDASFHYLILRFFPNPRAPSLETAQTRPTMPARGRTDAGFMITAMIPIRRMIIQKYPDPL